MEQLRSTILEAQTMQSKAKTNSVITHGMLADGRLGFNVAGAGSIALDVGKLSDGVKARAMLHGLIQRISDAAAISRDPATGRPASPAEKLAAMRELVEHYETGTAEWGRRGTGAGVAGGLLARALVEVTGKPLDVVREFLKGKSAMERTALGNSAKVKPVMDRLLNEAGKDVDGEKLLDELV